MHRSKSLTNEARHLRIALEPGSLRRIFMGLSPADRLLKVGNSAAALQQLSVFVCGDSDGF